MLRFVPRADLAVLDPVWTTTYQTRDHAFLVFDTLFGMDSAFRPVPQMVEDAGTEADGLVWTLRLREGLRFHDGEPVRARDCAASVRRWGRRDTFGQALLAATDAMEAPDDRTLRFRLKRPFPLLPDALARCRQKPSRTAGPLPEPPSRFYKPVPRHNEREERKPWPTPSSATQSAPL